MTPILSLYKIWRSAKGRSLKRWLSDEQVARYKALHPNWRWRNITEKVNRQYPSQQLQANTGYGRYSSLREAWGKVCTELPQNQLYLRDKITNPIISYDDILDTLLAAGKGI